MCGLWMDVSLYIVGSGAYMCDLCTPDLMAISVDSTVTGVLLIVKFLSYVA
jgi:hypothetical protein